MTQEFPDKPQPPQEPVFEQPVPLQPELNRREAMREYRVPWMGGTILVVLGIIFLLRNFGIFDLRNWWALFILIPAVGSFATAWGIYQSNGSRMTDAVRGPVIGGLIMSMVAAAFLFNLNWGLLWPVFLILIGVGALITGLKR